VGLRDLANRPKRGLAALAGAPKTDVGFDPEVSDPSLQMRAAQPLAADNGPEFYSPEGGYIAPAAGREPVWVPEDKEKVIFQALKVPYNLGFRGGPETDVFTEPAPEPAFSKEDMQQYQQSMTPQSPLGKAAGWGAEQAGLLPFYLTADLAAGAPLAAGAGKGLSWLSKITPKAAPAIEKIAPYAQTFASGFGLGAPVGAMESYGAGESLPDVAKSALESGLSFGGFNVGMKGAGSLIKKGLGGMREAPKAARQAVPALEPKAGGEVMPKIDNLNPTGGVFAEYTPQKRMEMPLADNITTLDKTAGKPPDTMVTIYRGASKNQAVINPGDFVTTNLQLAKDYAGNGKILKSNVPMKHILDDKTEPLGEEYIYRPKAGGAFPTIEQLTPIPGSKVVNKKGEPQLVYHGSTSEFKTFKIGDIGFHFGTKTQARSRVGRGKNAKLHEAYLDIKNPVVINKDLGSWDADYKLPEELLEIGAINKQQYDSFRSKSYSGDGYNSKASIEMRKILEQNGYDGIKYTNWHEGGKANAPSWIAFKDSQIIRDTTPPLGEEYIYRPKAGGNPLLGEGSISAAKGSTPGKMEPTGNPNEYTQSFVSAAAHSPAVDRNVKDILWWDLQAGEQGTYGRRTHKMISGQADGFIASNPEAAYRRAVSVETIANEPDLSVAIGIKLAEHHQKTNPALADEILNEIGDQLTKHGQAISASRLLVRMTPQGMINNIEKNIGKLNKEGLEQYGKKWKDIKLTSPEREAISRLKIGDKAGYEALNEQIQTRIGNELPATAMERVNAWRHVSMLLNPKTQIRNIGGNLIMAAQRRAAKKVSAVLQGVVLKPEARTQVFSVKKEYKEAAAAYFEANKRDLLGGPNKYQENIKLNMPGKRVFRNNPLEATRKFTYKLLEMGDTPFFKNAYTDRLASFAQARNIKDFSKLPKEAFETALKEAEEATYKDASELAAYLNKLKNPGTQANQIQKIGAFGLEAAIPFVKTPLGLIKRGIQYSPVGILNGIGKWKTPEAAAAGIDEMAKGLTGTAILGLGYVLASKEILTGKASEDADVRAYNANAGQPPFSIMGKYTYDWMMPFAVPLSVGVEVYNALKENPLEQQKMDSVVANNDTSRLQQIAVTVSGGIIDALTASGDTVFNMSVLKGLKNLLGNPQGVTAGLSQLPQQYASQFIPTLSSQVAGLVDPTVRQSYEKGNLAGSMKNALLSKIPFASRTLPAKQTPYGEDVKREQNPALRVFGQFLSPGNIATDQNVKPGIDEELRRLNAEGLKNQFPTITPNYIDKTQKHPRINLTAEEATQYQKRTGKLTEEAFNKILNSSAYQNAKANKEKNKSVDEVKADMLAKAIADAKAKAKAEIVESKGYKAN